MRNGQWQCFSESLKFNVNGDLVDGNHRLNAVIESGKSYIFMSILRGLPLKSILAIDNGMSRSLSDSFVIAGRKMKNLTSNSGAIGMLSKLQDCFVKDLTFQTVAGEYIKDNMAIIEFHKKLDDYNDVSEKFFRLYKYSYIAKHMGLNVALALYYMFHDADDNGACHSVFMTYENGIPFDSENGSDSPAFMAVNRIRKIKEVGGRIKPDEAIKLWLWAYTHTLQNHTIKALPKTQDWLFMGSEIPQIIRAKKKLMQG